jgi:Polynucleotide kinase 3 phosphatase
MKQIFSWGYEAPNKHDFTKKEQSVTTKIRKMKRAYISESHDNFRRPEQGLFNYFDQQDFELLKKRVYGLTIAAQNEGKLQSAYQEFFDSDKMKILKSEVK